VYTAYQDVSDVMDLTQQLIQQVAKEVFGSLKIVEGDDLLDLEKFERISFADLMKDSFDISPEESLECWVEKLKKKGVKIQGKDLSRTQLINLVAELIEPAKAVIHEDGKRLRRPVFVTDYFAELSPLARRNKKNPHLSERFELYVGGMELANGYSEQNDPIEQRARLEEELKDKGRQAMGQTLDEDFVEALLHGMPPAGGLGIGIDRLVMLLTHQPSIREVILFPQMKSLSEEDSRGLFEK